MINLEKIASEAHLIFKRNMNNIKIVPFEEWYLVLVNLVD